jgi:N-acetyl-anhydromuramyl-L-alanine amidase AmpD
MPIDRSGDVTRPMVDEVTPASHPLAIKSFPAHRNNYQYARPDRVIRFVVLHCTDGHEGIKQDDNVAAMFASRDLFPRRSCHYVVDADSVTQCVDDDSVAWQCGRTGNLHGVGIEICGFARQTRAEWLDAFSKPTLAIAARLTYELCRKHRLPLVFLNADDLQSGASGITTHSEVSKAWKESSHTDPGKQFPMNAFMKAVTMAARP